MANDEMMRLVERVENLAWVPGHKHKLDAVVADLRALAQRAPQHGAVPEGWHHRIVATERGFQYDDGLRVHTPTLLVKFRSVDAEKGDVNAPGWRDRDALAAMLAAAPAPEAEPKECPYCGADEHDGACEPQPVDVPEAERAKGEKSVWVVRSGRGEIQGCIEGPKPEISLEGWTVKKYTHPAPPPAGQPEGLEALVIEPTRCKCHPETCCCGDYTLRIDGEEVITGSKEQLKSIVYVARRLASTPQTNTHNRQDQP